MSGSPTEQEDQADVDLANPTPQAQKMEEGMMENSNREVYIMSQHNVILDLWKSHTWKEIQEFIFPELYLCRKRDA